MKSSLPEADKHDASDRHIIERLSFPDSKWQLKNEL